jgi:hypothetical protein
MYGSARNEVRNLCDSAQRVINKSAQGNALGRRSTGMIEP